MVIDKDRSEGATGPTEGTGSQGNRDIDIMMPLLVWICIGGLVVIFLHAFTYATGWGVIPASAPGLMVASASLLGGALLGFLFGIPRALQYDRSNDPSARDMLDSQNERHSVRTDYQPNTNLEQISDWLTKILVGIGLTQILNIPDALGRLADSLSGTFGGAKNSGSFAVVVVLYFLICGFLIGYLWTRLFFAGALTWADARMLRERVTQAERVSKEAIASSNEAKRQLEERDRRDA